MRGILLIGVFLGILVMLDGVVNDYGVTHLITRTLVLSVRDFFWFVGNLVGLTR
jgi:hypothetical protein